MGAGMGTGTRPRRRHGGGGGDERRRSRGVVVYLSRGPLFFLFGVCRIRTFNVGIKPTYLQMSSVFGPSMSGNGDTKVSRHTKNHVAKIGLSGQNLATFWHVANMSPTFPAKYNNHSPRTHFFITLHFWKPRPQVAT